MLGLLDRLGEALNSLLVLALLKQIDTLFFELYTRGLPIVIEHLLKLIFGFFRIYMFFVDNW